MQMKRWLNMDLFRGDLVRSFLYLFFDRFRRNTIPGFGTLREFTVEPSQYENGRLLLAEG